LDLVGIGACGSWGRRVCALQGWPKDDRKGDNS
jgi:hypothetical protein